jgi:hypothetical protein
MDSVGEDRLVVSCLDLGFGGVLTSFVLVDADVLVPGVEKAVMSK